MIHTSPGQKVDGKYIIVMYYPIREQNVFHVNYIPPILRLVPMEHFPPKLSDTIVRNYLKKSFKSASDYIETAYSDAMNTVLNFHSTFP